MIIKNSIKAIIIKGNKLLTVQMRSPDEKEYYTLPGGKQNPDELMIDALKREVREETGYDVEPKSLLFIREGYKEESHRIEFMFICDIVGEGVPDKTEYDENQIGTKWLLIDNIRHEELHPMDIRDMIKRYYLGKSNPIYLGEMEN